MEEPFDIEVAKARLEQSKQQYNELLNMYSQVKASSHPKQIFPSIEAWIHKVEQSIENETNLITNWEELQRTLKIVDEFQAESNVWTKY